MTLGNNELYIQLYCSSPAPKRDYHGLTITNEFVTLNSWDISHGPHVYPRRFKTPLAELIEDDLLQHDIQILFGIHVLKYALQISRGERRLHTLPNQLFLKVLRFLASNDIICLGQTSKIFFELCNSNPVWKILYRKRTNQALTNQELSKAEKQSWKYLLKKKLTEKLAIKNISEKYNKTKFPKPKKEILDEVEYYSKPIVHKKRPPPTEIVPKLDVNIDFKSLKDEKSISTVPNQVKKKSVTIVTPKSQNPASKSKKENPFTVEVQKEKVVKKWTSSDKITSTPLTKAKESQIGLTRGLSSPNITPKSITSILKNKNSEALLKKPSSPVLSEKVQSPKSPILKNTPLTSKHTENTLRRASTSLLSNKVQSPLSIDTTLKNKNNEKSTSPLLLTDRTRQSPLSKFTEVRSPKNLDLKRNLSSPLLKKQDLMKESMKVQSEVSLCQKSPKKSSQTTLVKKSKILN